MSEWTESLARPLRALHLDGVRNRILVVVVLTALIPTLVTTVVSYRQSRRSLSDQIALELRSVSAEAAREVNLWLDERLGDLRVSASAYVVSDNLTRIRPGSEGGQASGRLREYLNSVRQRLADCEALLVMDETGRVVIRSAGRTGGMQLSAARLSGLRTGTELLGDAYWDPALGRAAIVLAVPIRQTDGRFLGAFIGKIALQSVADMLQRLVAANPGDVYLMTDEGRLIIRSRVSSAELMRTKLPAPATEALLDREGTTVRYRRGDGEEVVATLRRVPQLRWAAVAEVPQAEAFRPLARLRTVTTWLLATLLAAVGLAAYLLAAFIARPLERLSKAAAKVASGDLSVELPVGGSGEVGYVTRAFSHVVGRLREREGQGELERLSVTDALTGLYNRRHLVGTLANEVQRSRRLRRTFGVLMADVDHFKRYNDTHGHLAGDAALVKIAEILRKTTRGVDCVARYGGEEFLVMLLETTITVADTVGRRIRDRVAAETFEGGRITVSIGVAEYPSHGDTPEELIASADAAMYQAKTAGRDRVVTAGASQEQQKKRRRKGET
ncbi:MAG: diguanylate cyclase [Gemmatimonadales bacterium]